jgi:deoxyribodipyrimidine photolyase
LGKLSAVPPTIMWFRRDLRLADNLALCAAVAEAGGADTYPVFVLDPELLGPAGAARRAFLAGCLDSLKVHQPWKLPDGPPPGYPDRIVDHAAERQIALDRYAETR